MTRSLLELQSRTGKDQDTCQIGAQDTQPQAAKVAISVRTYFAPYLTADRARPIVPTIPRGCGRRARCASCFVRSAACRSRGRSRRPTNRSRCTLSRGGGASATAGSVGTAVQTCHWRADRARFVRFTSHVGGDRTHLGTARVGCAFVPGTDHGPRDPGPPGCTARAGSARLGHLVNAPSPEGCKIQHASSRAGRFAGSCPDGRQNPASLGRTPVECWLLTPVGVGPPGTTSRPLSTRVDRASRRSYMFRPMFWPLAGGLIAFILVAILLGWILDPSRRGDADGHGPGH